MVDWFVYIIDKNGSFYTGITTDLKNRLQQHKAKNALYTENCRDRDSAVKRERVRGRNRVTLTYLPEVILERDKERRVKRSHSATQAMSEAVAAQKRPAPSGSPIFESFCGVASRLCAAEGTLPSSRLALTSNLGLQIVNVTLLRPLGLEQDKETQAVKSVMFQVSLP